MKSRNVTYFCRSDLKYTKNDLKLGKNDLKYYDLKWDFPLGGLSILVAAGEFLTPGPDSYLNLKAMFPSPVWEV